MYVLLTYITTLFSCIYCHIDGHETKPAISILAIVEKSSQTSNFRYFATYSIYVLT